LSKALLIIDVQNDYFEGGKSELKNPMDALRNIELVLGMFREKKFPVIHVQHINTRQGAAFFLPETEGVKIHINLTPIMNEHIVIKHAPNSFYETELDGILFDYGITELVICGMMSHMCVDTTVRACKDRGLMVTLLHDACTTKDLVFKGETIPSETVHQTFMASLQGMFANVIETSELNL